MQSSGSPSRHRVTGSERIGPYTLLRLERGGLDPGVPGQFFMLEAPGRLLPRPFSLCLAPRGELAFLVDPIGPGTQALCGLRAGDEIGPEPMLQAVAELCPTAQLAWEAPMACGYGGCYGCVVEIDGALKRLCLEGPVLDAARVRVPAEAVA